MFVKIFISAQVLFYFFHRIVAFSLTKMFFPSRIPQWMKDQVYLWSIKTLKVLGIQADVKGQEHIREFPDDKPVFIVSNHQSFTDIPVLYFAFNQLFGFVAKVELGKIPLLNYWMNQLGCILIDRKKYTQAIRTIKRGAERGELKPLSLFPEGTRNKSQSLAPFKPGVLKLAWSVRAHIQPVVIVGTRMSWEDRQKPPFPVKVQLLPALEWTDEMTKDFEAFSQALHKEMKLALEISQTGSL